MAVGGTGDGQEAPSVHVLRLGPPSVPQDQQGGQ